jgi:excisionase family DNA binding protein
MKDEHAPESRLLTVEEAAKALHATVKVSAIRAAIREGRLASVRIGRRYYVTPEALRRFAKCRVVESRPACGVDPTPETGSSSTEAASTGRALAEQAARMLRARRSPPTSSGASRPASALPSRTR